MDNKQEKLNNISQFQRTRSKEDLQAIYGGEVAVRNLFGKNHAYKGGFKNDIDVRKTLRDGLNTLPTVIAESQKAYVLNPIYASLIDYLSTLFLWRYVVIPHEVEQSGELDGVAGKKTATFVRTYMEMLDLVEGLNLEQRLPYLLTRLFTDGSIYLTSILDEDSFTIDTILLPPEYCRRVAETQYATNRFEFDYSYFKDLGLSNEQLIELLKNGFTPEIHKGYLKYLKDTTNYRWQPLDARYSACVVLNEKAIPNLFYSVGAIDKYEKYSDNELERNENKLKYIVVHEIPHFQDKLLLETDEVRTIHQSLAKKVDSADKARLITTYGQVYIEKIGENESTENKTLLNAYRSIYNNIGLNDILFTGESVQALKYSLIKDKNKVWKYVENIMAIYNLVTNNWWDFGDYQADITMLKISPYSYEEDVESFRKNATLGIGKLDYMVATGVKQKHIQDRFNLEKVLNFDQITPLQTSYTQTEGDRSGDRDADEADTKVDSKKTPAKPAIPSKTKRSRRKDNSD